MLRKWLAPLRWAGSDTIGDAPHGDKQAIVERSLCADDERSGVIAKASVDVSAGRFEASLARLNQALAASPNDPKVLFARGSTLFTWGRRNEALESFLRAEAAGLN